MGNECYGMTSAKMTLSRVHLLNERSTLMRKYLREQPKAPHSALPLPSLNRQVLVVTVTLALQPNQLLSYYHASDCDKDTSVNTLWVSLECQLTSQLSRPSVSECPSLPESIKEGWVKCAARTLQWDQALRVSNNHLLHANGPHSSLRVTRLKVHMPEQGCQSQNNIALQVFVTVLWLK